MADLKDMTVQALRDLARKALGRGQSRLKTKEELVEALQAAGQKVEETASRVRKATQRAARAAETAVDSASKKTVARSRDVRAAAKSAVAEVKRAAREAGAKVKEVGKAAKKAGKEAGRAASEAAEAARGARKAARQSAGEAVRETARAVKSRAKSAAAATAAGAKAAREVARRSAEGAGAPDPEGYFVARVRGEDAVREAPHPMTETAAEAAQEGAGAAPPSLDFEPMPGPEGAAVYDEELGDLPWSYGDDAFIGLPRDPRTLFFYWDLAHATLAGGFAGLEDARAQLWVFARRPDGGEERVRAVEFALESRGYYVHDLEPGLTYRAEIHAVDRAGRERLLVRSQNEVWLPAIGPSPIIDDRFARIPWELVLSRWLKEGHAGGPFSDEARAALARLSDWSRFGGRVWGGSAGGMGGRPFSPTSSPSSAFGPFTPFGGGENL